MFIIKREYLNKSLIKRLYNSKLIVFPFIPIEEDNNFFIIISKRMVAIKVNADPVDFLSSPIRNKK